MITQIQLISYILTTGDLSSAIAGNITVDYFTKFKKEFSFIMNHFNMYNQVPDKATFLKTFPDFEILEVKESPSFLINELYKEKNQSIIVSSYNKVKGLVENKNTDKAIDLINETAEKLSSSKSLAAVDILDDTSRFQEYADKCNDLMKYYVTTGFKELDKIIGGFDRKSEYGTIIARAGVGKSWVCLKCACAAVERGLTVGLYSGEMELNKVSYRIDTLMSHISNTKLVRGNSGVSMEYKKYLDNLKSNHKGKLLVLTPEMIGGDPTVDSLAAFIEKYNLDILFVDQQTLLVDKSNARTSFDKAANISKALKMLQVHKQIPIITVTQQNRTAVEEGKFAGTENIGQSDRIGQDSTLILSVTKDNELMHLHIIKARDGGSGVTLDYLVNLDKGEFSYVPAENGSQQEDDEEELPFNYSVNTEEESSPF